jgi:hypothetical protein
MNIGNIGFPFEVGIQPTGNTSELRQPDHANIDNIGKTRNPEQGLAGSFTRLLPSPNGLPPWLVDTHTAA